jgi:hypothetical protein
MFDFCLPFRRGTSRSPRCFRASASAKVSGDYGFGGSVVAELSRIGRQGRVVTVGKHPDLLRQNAFFDSSAGMFAS